MAGSNAAYIEQAPISVQQPATARTSACARILRRIALVLMALVVQALLVPGLNARAPFLATLAFALVIVARCWSPQGLPILPPLSPRIIVSFVACHGLLGAFAHNFSAELVASRDSFSLAASVISVSKLLVLVPSVLLFPGNKGFVRQLAPELAAALLVLFTYAPERLFHLIWPVYSRLLGAAIASLSALFVSGAHLVAGTDSAVVIGPALDMYLDVSCSGISGLTLFQLVFGFIVVFEWNRVKGTRALLCYAVGASVFLVANCLRLVIVFVTGNVTSLGLNLNAYAWILFVVIFLGLLRICHNWLTPASTRE
jgi:hypothetical protein